LLLQLRQRFGRIPAAAAARIGKAGGTELDIWFSRVLTAVSLAEVLEATAGAPPNKATTRPQARGAGQRTRG
jgi:hypothetical protein